MDNLFPNTEVLEHPKRIAFEDWSEQSLQSYQMQCEGYIQAVTYTNIKNPDIQCHMAKLIWFGSGFYETFATAEDAEKAAALMRKTFEFAGRHFI